MLDLSVDVTRCFRLHAIKLLLNLTFFLSQIIKPLIRNSYIMLFEIIFEAGLIIWPIFGSATIACFTDISTQNRLKRT